MKRELAEYVRLALLQRDRIIAAAERVEDSHDEAAIRCWNARLRDDEHLRNAFCRAKGAAISSPVLAELTAAREAHRRFQGLDSDEACWQTAMEWHATEFNTLVETLDGLPDEFNAAPSKIAAEMKPKSDSEDGRELAALKSLVEGEWGVVMGIAANKDLSIDEKMIRIALIKSAATGWKSEEWGRRLGVTGSRIRQQTTWKKWREADRKD